MCEGVTIHRPHVLVFMLFFARCAWVMPATRPNTAAATRTTRPAMASLAVRRDVANSPRPWEKTTGPNAQQDTARSRALQWLGALPFGAPTTTHPTLVFAVLSAFGAPEPARHGLSFAFRPLAYRTCPTPRFKSVLLRIRDRWTENVAIHWVVS